MAFGIWSGIIILGPLIPIIKHVRIQLIVMMGVSVAFVGTCALWYAKQVHPLMHRPLGALVTCNPSNFGRSAAFSFLATFPAGILEVAAGLLVQLDSNDADLGTVFGKFLNALVANFCKQCLTIGRSAIIFLGRSAIGTVFTAVFVAILNNKVPSELASHVPPAAESAGLPASSIPDLFKAITAGTAAALEAVPGMTPEIAAAVGAAVPDAYAAAYAYVYYAAIAVGLVGLIGE